MTTVIIRRAILHYVFPPTRASLGLAARYSNNAAADRPHTGAQCHSGVVVDQLLKTSASFAGAQMQGWIPRLPEGSRRRSQRVEHDWEREVTPNRHDRRHELLRTPQLDSLSSAAPSRLKRRDPQLPSEPRSQGVSNSARLNHRPHDGLILALAVASRSAAVSMATSVAVPFRTRMFPRLRFRRLSRSLLPRSASATINVPNVRPAAGSLRIVARAGRRPGQLDSFGLPSRRRPSANSQLHNAG
jgi:hypothetical protein